MAPTGFPALGLADSVIDTLTALGYEEPTPVQRETIPLMLAGRDLLAQAATGTGKTAAFALPMIQMLGGEPGAGSRDSKGAKASKDSTASHVRGVVLVPTRELAMQVSE